MSVEVEEGADVGGAGAGVEVEEGADVGGAGAGVEVQATAVKTTAEEEGARRSSRGEERGSGSGEETKGSEEEKEKRKRREREGCIKIIYNMQEEEEKIVYKYVNEYDYLIM